MAMLLSGKAAVVALTEKMAQEAAKLRACGTVPTLAVVRVGERGDDIAYEKSAAKRCAAAGVEVRSFVLPTEAAERELIEVIEQINADKGIHGCLLFRPLPKTMDDRRVCNTLAPEKDVDGITDTSMAGVYSGSGVGFPPCTPSACMEILDYYGIDVTGKRAVVIGRSLVVGKPAAMMLIKRNATVTVCHTRTKDMPAVCREADILVVSAGRAGIVNGDYIKPGAVVVDVGINVDENGKLCGDVDFDSVEPAAGAVTPVPGGVGTVTASVLVVHTVQAAKISGQ